MRYIVALLIYSGLAFAQTPATSITTYPSGNVVAVTNFAPSKGLQCTFAVVQTIPTKKLSAQCVNIAAGGVVGPNSYGQFQADGIFQYYTQNGTDNPMVLVYPDGTGHMCIFVSSPIKNVCGLL